MAKKKQVKHKKLGKGSKKIQKTKTLWGGPDFGR